MGSVNESQQTVGKPFDCFERFRENEAPEAIHGVSNGIYLDTQCLKKLQRANNWGYFPVSFLN